MRKLLIALVLPVFLAACGADYEFASDAEVQAARYEAGAPYTVTLMTAISNRSGAGGHSALLINGSQRVIWDPAGTWYHRTVPIRHDVHYGINDTILEFYVDYHARETYHVVMQEVEVSRETADLLIRKFEAHGPSSKAFCSNDTSSVLSTTPGFETIPRSFYPKKTMEAFRKLPGVREWTIYDDDDDDNSNILVEQGVALR
ncbi:MAG: hypothetical protein ACWA47_06735 [Brevirhabdus sp.]